MLPNIIEYEELFADVCMRPRTLNLLSDKIIPLKTSNTRSELKVPVQNTCACLWSLEEIVEYVKIDENHKQYYECPSCTNHGPTANRRYLDELCLNRQMALYIALAKQKYTKQVPTDKEQKSFKNGNINFLKNGTVEYTFDVKQGSGKIQKKFVLKDPLKLENTEYRRFNQKEYKKNPTNAYEYLQNMAKRVSQKIRPMFSLLQATGNLKQNEVDQQIEGLCSKLEVVVRSNIKMIDYQNVRYSDFTFGFFSPSETEKQAISQLSFLVAYYPHFLIWRKFQLVCGQLPFQQIESAVYLRDPSGKYIYIIGGCKLKRVEVGQTKLSMRSPLQKQNTNLKTCFAIDLSKVDPLRPTSEIKRVVQKGIIPKSTIEKVIGEAYQDKIHAIPMSDLPEEITASAGVIHNNFIYIFGGSRVKGESQQALNCAYRLLIDAKKNKWEKLNPLPTPRRGHSVFVRQNRIYIIGGCLIEKGVNTVPVNTVDIFDPNNGKYESKPLVLNPYLLPSQTQLIGSRSIVCQLNNDEFMLLNGDKNPSIIFNAKTFTCSYGGYQANLPTQQNAHNCVSEKEPKFQQVYDKLPIKYNGYFYYMHKNIQENRIRTIYCDTDFSCQIDETDPQKTSRNS